MYRNCVSSSFGRGHSSFHGVAPNAEARWLCPRRWFREPRYAAELKSVRMHEGWLEVTIGRSRYQITRWPGWSIWTVSPSGERRPAPAKAQRALDFVLQEVRVERRPDWRRALYAALAALPLQVHAQLAPMEARYFAGLRFLAAFPTAAWLLESNPALFALVSAYWDEGWLLGLDDCLAGTLVGKQRALAAILGLPLAEWQVRVLRKLAWYPLSAHEWSRFARQLRNTALASHLQHAPFIAPSAVMFLASEAAVLRWSPKLAADWLAELLRTHHDYAHLTASNVHNAILVADRLGIEPPACHFRQLEDVLLGPKSRLLDVQMPYAPALPGLGAEPLLTLRALKQEGEEMHHCLGQPQDLINGLRGSHAYYRITAPERLTLSLVREHERWTVDQLRGPNNAEVEDKTRTRVARSLG